MKFTIRVSKKYETEIIIIALILWGSLAGWGMRAMYVLFSPQGHFNSMFLSMTLIALWLAIAVIIPVKRFTDF